MNETITPRAVNESSRHYIGWAVVVAAFTGVMVSFAPIVPYTFSLFLNPLHAAFGWKREAIGGTFALAAITVAVVSPFIGLLLDRFPPRRIILPSILIFALALASLSRLGPDIRQFYFTFFVLGLVAYAGTSAVALVGAAILGVGLGSEADVAPYLLAHYFGRRHFSVLYGLTWTAYAIGGATGPMAIGRWYDSAASYQPRFIVYLACVAFAAALISLVLRRSREQTSHDPGVMTPVCNN
jgi:MFS family permease